MTVYQTILALAVFLALIGAHNAINRLLSLLDGHMERLQSKLDVLVAAQTDYNVMLDGILKNLL